MIDLLKTSRYSHGAAQRGKSIIPVHGVPDLRYLAYQGPSITVHSSLAMNVEGTRVPIVPQRLYDWLYMKAKSSGLGFILLRFQVLCFRPTVDLK